MAADVFKPTSGDSCLVVVEDKRVRVPRARYRHVKHHLESGVVSVNMHVEAEITKGKYHDYDTFIGSEAVEYLEAYLETRRFGNERIEGGPKRGMPPEEIVDSSPLIRIEHKTTVGAISPGTVHCVVQGLYCKAA